MHSKCRPRGRGLGHSPSQPTTPDDLFREKGRLALLVDSGCAPALGLAACTCCAFLLIRSQRTRSLHHRPLRVFSVIARWLPKPATSQLPQKKRSLRDPWCHPTFLAKTADLGIFRQALSIERVVHRNRPILWAKRTGRDAP